MRAWLFQDSRQRHKHGAKARWSVGWIDPDGERRSKTIGSKSNAEKFRRKTEGELAAGTYQQPTGKSWSEFRAEYQRRMFPALAVRSQEQTELALNAFERIVKPKRVSAIKTTTIDDFIEKRLLERGKKKGDTVSPATVNKQLRHIKAVLRVAVEWKHLPEMPRVRMLREPEKLPRYVTPEHFAAMYGACDAATRPRSEAYTPADWWQALLVFVYMTGWRISEPLALRWDDVSLDKGTAITRHGDNKGNRDHLIPLHPIVVDHLRKIIDFGPVVFSWPHHNQTLYLEFAKIQAAAGIHLDCHENHEHTDACHCYGFHDLRRAFATVNAETLSGDALQRLMRHRSYSTTQRYINMAEQVNRSIDKLYVPEVLRDKN